MPRVVFEGPTVDSKRGEYDDQLLIKARILVDDSPLTYGGAVQLPCSARDLVDAIHAANLIPVALRRRGEERDRHLATWPEAERDLLREALEDDDPVCGHCGTKDGGRTCREADRILFSCTNYRRAD